MVIVINGISTPSLAKIQKGRLKIKTRPLSEPMWTHVFPSCFLCLPALFTIITIIDIINSILLLVTSCFSLSPICDDLMCIYRNHFKCVLEKFVRLLYIHYLVIFKIRSDNVNSTKMIEWKNEDKPKFIQMVSFREEFGSYLELR